jgi:outer membrane immunogenic protein
MSGNVPTIIRESADLQPVSKETAMKRTIAAVSALAALTGSAPAADLAVKAYPQTPAPAVVPVYNWTGCYVGAGAGYGMYSADHDQIVTGLPNGGGTAFPVGTVSQSNQTTGGRGWDGIVSVGCDYQFATSRFGNWVIGGFADFEWSDIKGDTVTFAHYFGDGSAVAGVGSLKLDSKWSIGGRLGWLVMPQLLTYFDGGFTEARFGDVNFTNNLAPFIGTATGLNLPAQTYQGWFIGAGTEYAVGWWPGLFLKTEYRYSSYDTKTIGTNCLAASAPGPAPSCTMAGPSGFADRYTPHVQTVLTELVYRFNWGGGYR